MLGNPGVKAVFPRTTGRVSNCLSCWHYHGEQDYMLVGYDSTSYLILLFSQHFICFGSFVFVYVTIWIFSSLKFHQGYLSSSLYGLKVVLFLVSMHVCIANPNFHGCWQTKDYPGLVYLKSKMEILLQNQLPLQL